MIAFKSYVNYIYSTLCTSNYVAWVLISSLPYDWAFLLISVVEGLVAAVVWNQFGVYVINLTASTGDKNSGGYFNGVFFSIFGLANVLGSVISTALVDTGMSITQLLYILCIIGTVGCLSFLFLPSPFEQENNAPKEMSVQSNEVSVSDIPVSVKNSEVSLESTEVSVSTVTINSSKVLTYNSIPSIIPALNKETTIRDQLSDSWNLFKHADMQFYSVFKNDFIHVILDILSLFWICHRVYIYKVSFNRSRRYYPKSYYFLFCSCYCFSIFSWYAF